MPLPRLYAASVEPLKDDLLFARAFQAASPARREKTARLVRPEDQRLSLGAEMLLNKALSDAGAALPVQTETGPFGKPYVPGLGFGFNLSHSGIYVLCAVCAGETGCDVEKIESAPLDVARRFFSREEYLDIEGQPTPDARNELFFRYWTIRESYMKAIGCGLSLPQNAFRVRLGGKSDVLPNEGGYSVREFRCIPGYCAAMCAAEDLSEAEFVWVSLSQVLPAPSFPD